MVVRGWLFVAENSRWKKLFVGAEGGWGSRLWLESGCYWVVCGRQPFVGDGGGVKSIVVLLGNINTRTNTYKNTKQTLK